MSGSAAADTAGSFGSGGAPGSSDVVTFTSFVKGFQSTHGASMAVFGIVCVTIRSIALAIVRCRASASAPSP